MPRMCHKKVDRWRDWAELVNQVATLVFDVRVLHWWMTARCTILASRVLPANRDIAQGVRRICFILSSLEANLQTAVYMVVRDWKVSVDIWKSWDFFNLSAIEKKWINGLDACLNLNCSCTYINPLQQGALRTGDARVAWTALLGNEWRMLIRYQNQSTWRYRTQVGQMASFAKENISYPRANLWNPKLKASLTQVIWSAEIKQPFLSLSVSQALQINGATALLLQAETGRDKWHCG